MRLGQDNKKTVIMQLCIFIKISLKFIPKGPVYNMPALV